MIFNQTNSGGGNNERYIIPYMSQHLQVNSTLTYDGSTDYLDTKAVGIPNETVYVTTLKDWALVSITREDTGASVPFTTISPSSHYYNGRYSFVMPDANVIYDLEYSD